MKTFKNLGFSFLILGLIGLAVCAWWAQQIAQFADRAQAVSATVIELHPRRGDNGVTYAPEVEFINLDGRQQRLISNSSSYPAAYDVGEQVEVLIDPLDHSDARISGTSGLWLGVIIVGGIAAVFTLIGAIVALLFVTSARRRTTLQRNGTRIDAQVTAINPNPRISVNGRHPWQIHCQWRDPKNNKLYLFTSDNLDFDPSGFIEGETMPVLIARDNPKRYWVDTTHLPELA